MVFEDTNKKLTKIFLKLSGVEIINVLSVKDL